VTQPSPPVAAFLDRLHGVRPDSSGWSARCPCRSDDDNPSLHVGEGHDGRVLVTCHRGGGCSLPDICTAMGLTVNDLFADDDPSDDDPKEKPRLVATYDYVSASGELLFQKLRLQFRNGKKTFRQRRPEPGGGWSYRLGDVDKVLYRLPSVVAAAQAGQTVFVVEGEKDADTLVRLGYVATTNPGGAGRWLAGHTAALRGASVVVVRDNDDAGLDHAVTVRDALTAADVPVRILAPPDGYKDVTDWVEGGGGVDGLVEWVPPPPDPLDVLVDKIRAVQVRELPPERKLQRVRTLVDALPVGDSPVVESAAGRLVEWAAFVNENVDESYNWVIPGMLERQDRVIVVAAEGVGKTLLARQVAIASAYGVHPFTYEAMPAISTLTVDLENPERIIRRLSTRIVNTSERLGRGRPPAPAHLLIRPAGMDLLSGRDRLVLEETLERTEPALVCFGPLYKSFIDTGVRTSEALAVELAKYLDYLRTTYNFALWIEHHAPLGGSGGRELRPFGSAVWSRWPEFGWTLEPDLVATEPHVYKWGRFRNDREPRHRPVTVRRGKTLPFEVVEFFRPE